MFTRRFVTSISNLSRSSAIRTINVQKRSLAGFPPTSITDTDLNIFPEDWEKAKPYHQLPGPSKASLVRDFLPGGRCYKLGFREFMAAYYNIYGNIYRLPGMFGNSDILAAFDPSDFEIIYRTEGAFPLRPVLDSVYYYRTKMRPDIFYNGGLGIEQGKTWAEMRYAVNPVMMQTKTVRLYVPPINNIADEFIARMKKIRDPTSSELPSNFEDELNNWALETICVIALDARLGLIGNLDRNSHEQQFIKAVKAFFFLIHELDIKPSMWKWIRTPTFNRMMKTCDIITDFTHEHILRAKERYELGKIQGKSENAGEGVVERLLKINPQAATITAIDMITAGVDTTSSGATAILYHLATNPDQQEELRREILQILPDKNSMLTPENMAHMPYFRACFKESFRLLPVVDASFRGVGQNLVLQGYQIPKGTGVTMQLSHVQRRDDIYTQADKFLPERWLKRRNNQQNRKISENGETVQCPAEKSIPPFTFLPFGFGPRMCIGKRFAELEIEVLITKIIRNFRVEWHHEPLTFTSSTINSPNGELKFKLIDVDK